jgi:hypothetical protein
VYRADNITHFMCWLSCSLRASTSWNPRGLYRDCFTFTLHFTGISPLQHSDYLIQHKNKLCIFPVNFQNKKHLFPHTHTHRISCWLMAVQWFCNVGSEFLNIIWIWWIEVYFKGYFMQHHVSGFNTSSFIALTDCNESLDSGLLLHYHV